MPKLLKANGLKMDDYRPVVSSMRRSPCRCLYCRDKLGHGIPNDRLNVNGGAISIGHPYGMSGAA